jgi:hypothetical protein
MHHMPLTRPIKGHHEREEEGGRGGKGKSKRGERGRSVEGVEVLRQSTERLLSSLQALADGRVASCVYGAEHLLRLFVKLPELMAVAVATEQQAANVAVMVKVQMTGV